MRCKMHVLDLKIIQRYEPDFDDIFLGTYNLFSVESAFR